MGISVCTPIPLTTASTLCTTTCKSTLPHMTPHPSHNNLILPTTQNIHQPFIHPHSFPFH
ncbi:hypothetical protein HanXRQr2_Chr07g0287621 [Helianthus annuus]|uniref:Uncharacterized protein n=1 Tax=Helianthus annuus TaxID=4232 RepID=A0A251VDI8_HELAN|nr:hypothetical protein HanXRQr2_Chr07g0287621 [Helianthus annuus]KAJ0904136.1 hypothetical protein HanPSC8_Chr07g0278451 [Helianthus annuus]